jgi:hypothetical protein
VRPIGFGCQDLSHPHDVIVRGRRVEGPDGYGTVGLLTLWRCPVVHGLGGYWHDLRRDPERDGVGGGPGLDVLPSRP